MMIILFRGETEPLNTVLGPLRSSRRTFLKWDTLLMVILFGLLKISL